MHRILLGPYRSGKTGQLVRDLVAAKREYPLDRCLILVPSQRYGALVREKLAEVLSENADGPAGMFGVEIATIYDACGEVLRMAGEQQVVLPRELAAAVAGMAVKELKQRGALDRLGAISDFPGTSHAILELLDEFERAALTPAHVLAATSGAVATDSKYRELAEIYREYWSKLDELKCSDQKRMVYDSREILSRRDFADYRIRWLIVDGFDRISPLQAEVIQALSLHAAETHIAFDYIEPSLRTDEETDEYSWKDSSFEELRKRFPNPPEYAARVSTSGPAQQVAFKTLDGYFEMQEIARRCKEAILLRGTKPEQILVVARDIGQYATAAEAAFDNARIPYEIDRSQEYRDLPLFKLLMKMASLAHDDFGRREMCECLRSPFIDLDALGLKKPEVDSLDKKSIEKGVVGGREQWSRFLETNMPERVAAAVLKFFEMVTPPEFATLSAYCRWLEGIENVAIRKHTRLNLADPSENAAIQGLRQVVRTLVQQETLFGDQQCSRGQFLSLLASTADGATYRRASRGGSAIHICSAEQAPNRRFDEIFVAGVVEGHFPKHSGASGFVSAEERGRWSSFGVLLANPREEAGFERALFKSLIERARKRISFSLPEFTFGGEEAIPSFFLTDGTANVDRISHIKHAHESLKQPVSAREAVAGWLWLKPGIEIGSRLTGHPATEEFWQTINVSVLAAYQRHQKNSANAYNGYLVDLTQSHWLEVKLPSAWSASAFNNYGQCPFKFWLSNLLSIEPRREPEPGLAVDIRGRLYHKALEIYYSRMVQLRPEEREAPRENMLHDSLKEAIDSFAEDPQFTPGPYWENEQKDMLFRLRRFIEFDGDRSDAQPALFEARFGMTFSDQSYPPLIVEGENGPIVIRGVIDRVDIHETADGEPLAATVIDYKTSSSPISLADAQVGTNLQLPIYALAVSRSILPQAKVKSGHFLSINAAKSIGQIDFGGEKAAGLLEATSKRISDTVSAVRNGDFTVRPANSKVCKNCIHKPVCRVVDLKHAESEEF